MARADAHVRKDPSSFRGDMRKGFAQSGVFRPVAASSLATAFVASPTPPAWNRDAPRLEFGVRRKPRVQSRRIRTTSNGILNDVGTAGAFVKIESSLVGYSSADFEHLRSRPPDIEELSLPRAPNGWFSGNNPELLSGGWRNSSMPHRFSRLRSAIRRIILDKVAAMEKRDSRQPFARRGQVKPGSESLATVRGVAVGAAEQCEIPHLRVS